VNITVTNQTKPTIAIFGMGYVGCVSAACFAETGFHVIGVDIDERKLASIGAGRAPFHEPGLEPLIVRNIEAGRLTVSSSTAEAIAAADFAFLCVGTPSASNGNLGLAQLQRVVEDIDVALEGRERPFTLVVRSTVFPGTCEEVVAPRLARHPLVRIVANPEFLREGTAVREFLEPSLLVVGAHDREAAEAVAALYGSLPVKPCIVALRTAELIKYACNAFHAVKIAFANEIGALGAEIGVSGAEVMDTICQDTMLNISRVYLKPGFAFGGSCLPKDLRALNYRAQRLDIDLPMLNHVLASNEAHLTRAVRRVLDTPHRRLGVYGLSFKNDTDDLRESPAVALIERLIGKGRDVKIYDPNIRLDSIFGSNRDFLFTALPHISRVMESSFAPVLEWAEAIVVTLRPTPEEAAAIAASGKPVLDVTHGGRIA